MREVSKEAFYGPIWDRKLNVHPHIQQTPFPYTSIWKYQGTGYGKVYGKTVDELNGGTIATRYYLGDV